MTFRGCKGGPCKCAAVGVVCLCAAAAISHHDQFCEQQRKPTYCNLAWDMPHGPHGDQRPIKVVRNPTVVASTSSISTAMVNPFFFFKPPGSA